MKVVWTFVCVCVEKLENKIMKKTHNHNNNNKSNVYWCKHYHTEQLYMYLVLHVFSVHEN